MSKLWHNAVYKGPSIFVSCESLDDLGEAITKVRAIRGLSQSDMARMLGWKPQQLQRHEQQGWQKMSMWRMQELLECLGLNVRIEVGLSKGAVFSAKEGGGE